MSDNVALNEMLNSLPDNSSGRRLKAHYLLWEAVQREGDKIGTAEAKAEVKRIGRFLGFVEKMNRGRRASEAKASSDGATSEPQAAKPVKSTMSKPPAGFSSKPK